jgi:hypothetical protein
LIPRGGQGVSGSGEKFFHATRRHAGAAGVAPPRWAKRRRAAFSSRKSEIALYCELKYRKEPIARGQAVKPGSEQEKTQNRGFRLQPFDINRNRQGKNLENFGNPRNFLGISLEMFGKGLKKFGNLRRGESSRVPVRR